MWRENEGIEEDVAEENVVLGRASVCSEMSVVEERVRAAPAACDMPAVSNLNITKSSRVHIGPKFVSVTQNVSSTEAIKEVPLWKYLWSVVRGSSRAERAACGGAVLALALCSALIVYFTVAAKSSSVDVVDRAPHEWYITREMWLAQPVNYTDFTASYEPLRLVVVQHSVSPECHRFVVCAAELRNLQGWFLSKLEYDIPYNFIIGNDGRVYEGRGWGVTGAHTLGYNRCSVGIGFIGDYREEMNVHTRVTAAQAASAARLLAEGVRRGRLHAGYLVVGARDLQRTESPGSNLYAAIRTWDHYDHRNRYRNKTCQQIHDAPIEDDLSYDHL